MKTHSLKSTLRRFSRQHILVVGDVMADEFLWGEVSRISPEAPVPVVEVKRKSLCAGGAANVACNITSLGGQAALLGIIGQDKVGESLRDLLDERGVETSSMLTLSNHPTTLKTRVIARHQQMVRVDQEMRGGFGREVVERLLKNLARELPRANGVILTDYGKGVLSPFVLRRAIRMAHIHGKPVFVDPKVEHFKRYRHVDFLTPNIQEAAQGMGLRHHDGAFDLEALGRKILGRLKARGLIITQGEHGMTVFTGKKIVHLHTLAQEVFDVTGAGDTVIAVAAMAAVSGADLVSAARLANCAAGIVVGKVGTATVTQREIQEAL